MPSSGSDDSEGLVKFILGYVIKVGELQIVLYEPQQTTEEMGLRDSFDEVAIEVGHQLTGNGQIILSSKGGCMKISSKGSTIDLMAQSKLIVNGVLNTENKKEKSDAQLYCACM